VQLLEEIGRDQTKHHPENFVERLKKTMTNLSATSVPGDNVIGAPPNRTVYSCSAGLMFSIGLRKTT
jgi:hypothetical protein